MRKEERKEVSHHEEGTNEKENPTRNKTKKRKKTNILTNKEE